MQRRSLAADPTTRGWRNFVALHLALFTGLLAVYLAAIILIDPYDTGYFPSLIGPGVVDDHDVTSVLSRGRDSRFNAAIIGNSHALLLDPARLSPATGLSFVQLVTNGSGPREQMAVLRYFLRRHPGASAFVLVADDAWCMHDPALVSKWEPLGYQFPFWMFDDNRLRHLANMFNARSYGQMRRRILFAMGRGAPLDPARIAAYPATWNFAASPEFLRPPPIPLNGSPTQISTEFPAIDRLEALLASTPPDVAVVLILPPIYARLLPDPGTVQSVELASCKDRLARALAQRRRGAFIDLLVDSPLSRETSSFFDLHHMRANVARVMETKIAGALNEVR